MVRRQLLAVSIGVALAAALLLVGLGYAFTQFMPEPSRSAPTITQVAAAEGSVLGGEEVALQGSGFATGSLFRDVVYGGEFACGLTHQGSAYCWGRNEHGQLGTGNMLDATTPQKVVGAELDKRVVGLVAGKKSAYAIRDDGTLWVWGHNQFGQLGVGNEEDVHTPLQVPGLSGVTMVAAGGFSTYAVAGGTVYAWGHNATGQLGVGDEDDRATPSAVAGLNGQDVSWIAAGDAHAVAVADGEVYAWGHNQFGEIGNGSTVASNTPVQVSVGSSVQSVAAGAGFSAALGDDGRVYTWGEGLRGQLGIGATTNQTTPQEVQGDLAGVAVQQIAVGDHHVVALTEDQEVFAWGFNENGQLGNALTTNSLSPTEVSTAGILAGSTVLRIAAGGNSSAAVLSHGQIATWGWNRYGQLGQASVGVAVTLPGVVTQPGYTKIFVDDIEARVTKVTDSEVRFIAPPHDPGVVRIEVSADDVSTVTAANAYTYQESPVRNAPVIDDISPNSDYLLGGSSVTITGSGFAMGSQFAKVAVGADHTCGITVQGTVYCWGRNDHGQLGIGDTTDRIKPVRVQGSLAGERVVAVEAGKSTTYAITSSGSLYAWGWNHYGQLGDNTEGDRLAPAVVGVSGAVSKVVAGYDHACALLIAGTVQCWGNNATGQLGNGTILQSSTPVESQFSTYVLGRVTDIDAGYGFTVAVADGTVYAVGENAYGELGAGNTLRYLTPIEVSRHGVLAGKRITAVSAGMKHVMALSDEGELFAWGSNTAGELGVGTNASSVPVAVTSGALAGVQIASVVTGDHHTCAQVQGGAVACWGFNENGELGTGSTGNVTAPTLIDTQGVLDGAVVSQVAAGGNTTAVVTSEDALVMWGWNRYGQLGDGTTNNKASATPIDQYPFMNVFMGDTEAVVTSLTPTAITVTAPAHPVGLVDVRVTGDAIRDVVAEDSFRYILDELTEVPVLHDITPNVGPSAGGNTVTVTGEGLSRGSRFARVEGGGEHTCGLSMSGDVYCWGRNQSGQLGNGSTRDSTVPVRAMGPLMDKMVIQLALGASTTYALTNTGEVYAWGWNGSGQLGVTGEADSLEPVLVQGLSGVRQITAGAWHACAATGESTYCWGSNSNGQLGDGGVTNRPRPTKVGVIDGLSVVQLVAGDTFTLARTSSGTLYAWGENSVGQLGNGTFNQSTSPFLISASGDIAGKMIIEIAAGSSTGYALDNEGKVYAWGYGLNGETGAGSAVSRTSPTEIKMDGVLSTKAVTKITAGDYAAYAIDEDGALYAWGHNERGQLGVDSTEGSLEPVVVQTEDPVAQFGAGNSQACAVTAAGGLTCWGWNRYGQLGAGSTVDFLVPSKPMPALTPLLGTMRGRVIHATDNQVTFVVPAHEAGLVDLSLIDGASSLTVLEDAYTYIASPHVTTLTPNTGDYAGGDTVVISGSFGSGDHTVFIGENEAVIASHSASEIVVTVPSANTFGAVDVRVVDEYGQAYIVEDGFTYTLPAPVITAVDPGMGPAAGGETVDITGNYFYHSEETGEVPTVVFAGEELDDVEFIDSQTLRVVVPAHQKGLVDVTVTNPDAQAVTLQDAYEYIATPNITAISPATGLVNGGDIIVITGEFRQGGNVVTVGGQTATIVAESETQISVVLPVSERAGPRDVVVTDILGQADTVRNGFTYELPAPTISSVTPNRGPVSGGQEVSIEGTGFAVGENEYVQVSAGSSHSLALASDGTVYSWGRNSSGQLGTGSTVDSHAPVAVNTSGVLSGKTIIGISAGSSHSLALASDGTVYSWGRNTEGQLGSGSTTWSNIPVAVSTAGVLADKTITHISAGDSHSLALASDGTVYSWGRNSSGQLGTGSTVDSHAPVAVNTSGVLSGKTIIGISAGSNSFSLVLASDGTVYSWGWNAQGQLGNGSTIDSRIPVAVTATGVLAGKTITQVSAGIFHSLALASDGTVYSWGQNAQGQLGNSSVSVLGSNVPVAVNTTGVLASKTIIQIVTKNSHSLALASDGTVYSWGQNAQGQLGNSSTLGSNVPVAISTSGVLSGKAITQIAAGHVHSLSLDSDGKIYSWGQNTYGQLGDNSTAQSNTPVATEKIYGATPEVLVGNEALRTVEVQPGGMALSGVTAPHSPGIVDVVVTNYDGQSVVLPNAYEYVAAPEVTAISPNRGSLTGGNTVTITGSGFENTDTMRIWIGPTEVTNFTVVDDTTITAIVPARTTPGAVDVRVADEFGQDVVVEDGYTYLVPDFTVTSISPAVSGLSGGMTATIQGTGFVQRQGGGVWYDVYFGDTKAEVVTYVNSTTIRATVPSSAVPGVVDLRVDAGELTEVARELTDGFAYIANYVFTNDPLSLAGNEPGKLTIEARDLDGNPIAASEDTEIRLESTSSGGFFARDLTEDPSSRWDYETVILPAGATSVDVYYRDSVEGTPTVRTRVMGVVGTEQQQLIGSRYIFEVTGVSDPIQAGVPSSITVRVVDWEGRPQTDYTGTLRFESDDLGAILPANYTMKTTDNGVKTFVNGVTLRTEGEFCVTARDVASATIRGSQCDISVTPANIGTITRLAIVTPEQSFPSNGHSSPITIQAQSADGEPISVQSDTPIYLYSSSTTGQFNTTSNGSGWSSGEPFVVTIPEGLTSVSVYYRDTIVGTNTLSARDNTADTADNGEPGDFGWRNATQQIMSGVGAPTRISVSGPTRLEADQRGQYVVELQDENGNPVTAENDITIRVDANTDTARFYFQPDNAPRAGPVEFVVPAGSSRVTIEFSDSRAPSTDEFTALIFVDGRPETESVRLQDATHQVTIGLGDPHTVLVQALPETSIYRNADVRVDLVDEQGNITYDQTAELALSMSSSEDGVFGDDELMIPVGQSGAMTTYRGRVLGDHTITASNPTLAAGAATTNIAPVRAALQSASRLPIHELNAVGVSFVDMQGNAIVLDEAVDVTLLSDESSGSFTPSAVRIEAAQALANSQYIDTELGERILMASSAQHGVDTGELAVEVVPGEYNPDEYDPNDPTSQVPIYFVTDPRTFRAGEPGAITIGFRDRHGVPTTLTSDVTVRLTTTAPRGQLSGAIDPFASTELLTVPAGTTQKTFYYMDERTGEPVITVRDVSRPVVMVEQAQEVIAGSPATLRFETEPRITAQNDPSQVITVRLFDEFDNAARADDQGMTVQLSSDSSEGQFSATREPWGGVVTIDIPAGAEQADFYYRDSAIGEHELTAASDSLGSDTQRVDIIRDYAGGVAVEPQITSVVAGDIVPVELHLQTNGGEPTLATEEITMDLTPGGQFSLTEAPFIPATNVTFAAREGVRTVYYRATTAGVIAITADPRADGIASGSSQIEVAAGEMAGMHLATPWRTIRAGEKTDVIEIEFRDEYGNRTATGNTFTLQLTTNSAGEFSLDRDAWQPVTSVAVAAGSESARVYYTDTNSGTWQVGATADEYESVNQQVIVRTNDPVRVVLHGEDGVHGTRIKGDTYRITAILQDQYGNSVAPQQSMRFTVATTSATGVATPQQIVFDSLRSTAIINYRDIVSGTAQITLTGGSVTSNEVAITYTEGDPAGIRLTPATGSVRAGEARELQATLVNEYGIEVEALVDTEVAFTSDGSGAFSYTADGVTVTDPRIVIETGQSRASIFYQQTESGSVTIRTVADDLSEGTARVTVLPGSVESIGFAHVAYDSQNPLEISQNGNFRVQLYDVYGNITTTPQSLRLYATTGDGTAQKRVIVPSGASTAWFSHSFAEPGTYTIAVTDDEAGGSGALGVISQEATVIYGDPTQVQYDRASVDLERGGVASAQANLYNRFGGAVPAPAGGTTVRLMMNWGTGIFSATEDGTFMSTLDLIVPAGEFGQRFFYRNDDAAIERNHCYTTDGVRRCQIIERYRHEIRGHVVVPGGTVSIRALRVNMSYGPATQLVFLTPERTQSAQHPSDTLTVQRQNQYDKPVPVYADTRVYLRSSAGGTGEFSGSRTSGWGANYVTLLNGNDSVDFYYRDSMEGAPRITAADTVPLEPDVALTNAVQQITITRQALDHLYVSNISDPQRAGTASSVVVMARDADNFIIPWYDGTITFTSDDPTAMLPSDYTFDPAEDKGSKTFTNQVAFATPGEKVVTATDLSQPSVQGSQTDITVTPANQTPVSSLEISQPRSPAQFAVDAASPIITLQMRDEAGEVTTAPLGGMPVRLISTSPTAQFALSPAGPWTNGLSTLIPEGFTFLNFHYRDTALGQAGITASDWIAGQDSPDIANAELDVVVSRIGLRGDSVVYSQNAFGQMEESRYLFTSRADGQIVGRATNEFSAHNLRSGDPLSVLWRTQWRQGVVLINGETHQDRTQTVSINADDIQTEAGRPNFYATAEATDTTFAVPEAVVSRELTIPTSPWRLGIEQGGYALVDEAYEMTVETYRQDELAGAESLHLQVLPADATDATGVVYGETIHQAGGRYAVVLPEDILGELGVQYRLFVMALDADGETVAQILSDPFEVVETIPEPEEPGPGPGPDPDPDPNPENDPDNPTPGPDEPSNPSSPTSPEEDQPQDNTAVVEGQQPADTDSDASTEDEADDAPEMGDEESHGGAGVTSGGQDRPDAEGKIPTGLAASMYAGTLLLVVALLREAYKEVARVYRMRKELRRLSRIAKDKHTFLSLSAHHLRTPIALLEAGLSMAPSAVGLGVVVKRLQKKADQLLEADIQPDLDTIKDPDVQRATRSALRSIFFWLPIILSVALTVALNVLLWRTGQGLVHNDALVYAGIVGIALALIAFFGARTLYINKEREQLAHATERARAILFGAKTRFIHRVETDMRADIIEIRQVAAALTAENEIAQRSIQDGAMKLESLAAKLSLISTMDGVVADPTVVSARDLVQFAVDRRQAELAKRNITLDVQTDKADTSVFQDGRLLQYVMSTVLGNAIQTAQPGQTIHINAKSHGDEIAISISDNTADEELRHQAFDPFVVEADNAAGDSVGLDLYLDKLIVEHLGGRISVTDNWFTRGGSIKIRFGSL